MFWGHCEMRKLLRRLVRQRLRLRQRLRQRLRRLPVELSMGPWKEGRNSR